MILPIVSRDFLLSVWQWRMLYWRHWEGDGSGSVHGQCNSDVTGTESCQTSSCFRWSVLSFYHLLYAIAYKLTIISFLQNPTWMALYSI